jgi:PelA/Pel-15E family pectate lyase
MSVFIDESLFNLRPIPFHSNPWRFAIRNRILLDRVRDCAGAARSGILRFTAMFPDSKEMMRRTSFPLRPVLVMLFSVGLVANSISGNAPWESFAAKSDDWYRSEEGRRVASNILSFQTPEGSWPKNTNTTAFKQTVAGPKQRGTFDNGATTGELRFLARAFNATHDAPCEQGFTRGLDHILKAQYPTGGWPQYYPPGKNYSRHITFNDHAMVRLMQLLREIATMPAYDFVDAKKRAAARASFDRGMDCILKCQIKVNGKLTAWCAQHDEVDYSPRPARTFELASLSGSESVGIVRLLMSLDHPTPEVIRSVQGAVDWFETAKVPGFKLVQKPDSKAPDGFDRVVEKDPAAPPMWARFYEIGTNKPIFADRDGVKKYSLAEIGHERRNGYAWLGSWPETLLAKEFPEWRKKWVP